MSVQQQESGIFGRSTTAAIFCFVGLFIAVLAMHGKPVPYNNEFLYLPRLASSMLANDWSFATSASEHWLFNFVFGPFTQIISLEALGWAGRFVFWALCLIGILRVAQAWELPYWQILIAVGLWLGAGQAIVNAEWIFGTFEAKVVSYAFLFFSLAYLANGRHLIGSALLGLSFSFHPAIGLWAVAGVGLALLAERVAVKKLLGSAAVGLLTCLPGIIPLLGDQVNSNAASPDDWRFVVTIHMPYHFDPFYFNVFGLAVLAIMFVINIAVLSKATGPLRFFRNFQLAIAAFFVLGVLLRYFEVFAPLRLMPMRLFPIITPLFFFLSVFYYINREKRIVLRLAAAIIALALPYPLPPIKQGIALVRETRDVWRQSATDLEKCLVWTKDNTPSTALILATPSSRKLWYLSERTNYVSYLYPRYERLAEWRGRLNAMSNNFVIKDRASADETLDRGFESLSTEQIVGLGESYDSVFLISRTVYDLPIEFTSGEQKVYRVK
jgi:hypothetical protein